ncbi:DNA repair and recombination protein RadA [Vulcanisaeta souniana]|uniref:DNA repair and recombination protein RadA n=1 Tax=Vulcanisaeta souniana JCM 11219 TaxID=1293586 RepID=A0A830EE59_9CREN|nr:DNA repair and recombination protein RadA [Vulcanisaeta souniana]BDR92065.1 DNA repair and recombination protein RadA [Vulcanisaeta souniana JCM 11219]GGI68154.1 DNA repair and recombination protein RadA [Vulcanisaeta souniana JCM 11219]
MVQDNVDLEDLEGIGPKTAQLLKSKGVLGVRHLALFNPEELIELTDMTPDRVEKILRAARDIVFGNNRVSRATDIAKNFGNIIRLRTNVRAIDELLQSGLEPKAIYEFAGEFGTGKTQLCHQLSVTVQLSQDKGGVGGAAVYLDTEEAFSPSRIVNIAQRFDLDPNEALDNIYVVKVINAADLEDRIKFDVVKLVEQANAKLIVVDSIIALYRAEFKGRERLAERQQRLNYILDWLMRIAKVYNVYVVLTNQVLDVPMGYIEVKRPAGGNVLAHAVTHRLFLRKSKEDVKVMEVLDSPRLPFKASAMFRITDKGIEDV